MERNESSEGHVEFEWKFIFIISPRDIRREQSRAWTNEICAMAIATVSLSLSLRTAYRLSEPSIWILLSDSKQRERIDRTFEISVWFSEHAHEFALSFFFFPSLYPARATTLSLSKRKRAALTCYFFVATRRNVAKPKSSVKQPYTWSVYFGMRLHLFSAFFLQFSRHPIRIRKYNNVLYYYLPSCNNYYAMGIVIINESW